VPDGGDVRRAWASLRTAELLHELGMVPLRLGDILPIEYPQALRHGRRERHARKGDEQYGLTHERYILPFSSELSASILNGE